MSAPAEHAPMGSSTWSSGGTVARWTSEAQRLGPYRLCLELASGGMGTVHLAMTEGPHGFEKLVALKCIHPHLASDPRFVAMFLDEARIAAGLSHPNACGVIDFGEADGVYYMTMPFLLGEPLSRLSAARRESKDPSVHGDAPFVLARLIADACEGLHAAHELRDERGEPLHVVHRDVSPRNLFVGFEGTLSVLDFGVASARHRLDRTATGEVKGTFAYASPEQLEGGAVDRRSDVFSLGVVLWESLALRRLFHRGDVTSTMRAVSSDPIPPLRDVWPDAPLGLEEIVFKALARDPDRRYPTARAMGRDLLAFLSDERHAIGPPHVAEWVERLLPGARAEKERAIERARMDIAASGEVEVVDEPARVDDTTVDTPRGRRGARSFGVVALVAAALVTIAGVAVLGWPGVGAREDGASEQGARDEEAELASRARSLTEERASETESSEARAADDADSEDTNPGAAAAAAGDADSEDTDDDREGTDSEGRDAESATVDGEPDDERAMNDDGAEDDDAAPRARRGRGTVSIATPGGWARVYVGARRLGDAPGTFALPAGVHTLRIQPFGRGEMQRRRVRVPPGRTLRVSVPVGG